MTNALRIDVADLLTHPRARRDLRREAWVPGLATTAARVPADTPVELDLLLERVPDGIVVRGSLTTSWRAECSVCLGELSRPLDLTVSELFEPAPVEGETYALEGHEIDLGQLVRDTVLLELPLAPTCADTAAPCARAPAGAPDPATDDEAPESPDPRWAALSDLDL